MIVLADREKWHVLVVNPFGQARLDCKLAVSRPPALYLLSTTPALGAHNVAPDFESLFQKF
jgi:hypothetical protein